MGRPTFYWAGSRVVAPPHMRVGHRQAPKKQNPIGNGRGFCCLVQKNGPNAGICSHRDEDVAHTGGINGGLATGPSINIL